MTEAMSMPNRRLSTSSTGWAYPKESVKELMLRNSRVGVPSDKQKASVVVGSMAEIVSHEVYPVNEIAFKLLLIEAPFKHDHRTASSTWKVEGTGCEPDVLQIARISNLTTDTCKNFSISNLTTDATHTLCTGMLYMQRLKWPRGMASVSNLSANSAVNIVYKIGDSRISYSLLISG